VAPVSTASPDDDKNIRAALTGGRLRTFLLTATPGEVAALYAIVADAAFTQTQPRERARGHLRCATAPDRMEPECHDRFQDNIEAMLADLHKHGDVPIMNPEGWLIARFNAVTIDANRKRRGERGALQRPRLPRWLERRLGTEWERRLALEIMVWVGVPNSAGLNLWPLSAWADLRERITGETGPGETAVAADIEIVLATMRTNPRWYDLYIERPLGHKHAPVLPVQHGGREAEHLVPVRRDERTDARLRNLADLAVDAIARRLTAGEEATEAVRTVLGVVFGGGTGADGLGDVPGAGADHDERLEALIADPATVQRVVEAVVDIIRPGDAPD
jgi:hypothetical protein